MESFATYRETVRKRAEELSVIFPDGFCTIESVANAQKGSTPGVRTHVRVFTAAQAEIDGVAHAVIPEPAVTQEPEVMAPTVEGNE